MSLLPSRPDASPSEDAGPRVIGVDSEDADDVLAALSSGTARQLLAELHENPAPPSELAEQVDTSLQNVQYHLEKLQSAGAVEVVETAYSEKGREMDMYAPADQPLVIFAGDESEGSTLRSALSRLVGALGTLALGSLVVQELFGRSSLVSSLTGGPGTAGDGAASGGDDDAGVAVDSADDSGDAEVSTEGDGGDAGATVEDDGGGSGGGDGGDVSIASDGDATETAAEQATETTTRATEEPAATGTETPAETQTAVETSTETEAVTQTPTETVTETVTQTPTETVTETVTQTPTETVTETAANATAQGDEVVRTATEVADATGAAAGLPPGLVFFAGGVVVLAVLAVGLALRS
jgi:DNA-binding transcriptional ArsR family regulator